MIILFVELIKFLLYSLLIVLVSKYILVVLLRKLAEALNLKPKTVGNIAGVATSVPELLTISFSAFSGFMATSVYNVLSSNVINLLQYLLSVLFNKNGTMLKDRAIRIDVVLVVFTIILPILMLLFQIPFDITLVPIFLLLFFLFYFINHNVHKVYLAKQERKIEQKIVEETKWVKGKKKVIISYSISLIITAILLFVVGNLLSNVLEQLCVTFGVPEVILGILLGFITSIPELITFFESQKHYRKQEGEKEKLGLIEATNNLLTSNMLNLFIIQTIGIIIYSVIF